MIRKGLLLNGYFVSTINLKDHFPQLQSDFYTTYVPMEWLPGSEILAIQRGMGDLEKTGNDLSEEMFDAFNRVLAPVVVDWNFVDREGMSVQIPAKDPKACSKIPFTLLEHIMNSATSAFRERAEGLEGPGQTIPLSSGSESQQPS